MAEIRFERGLTPENTRALLGWANAGGEDFLRQFAGPKWRYPLTADQVGAEAGSIFSIYDGDRFAGIVQELYRREGRAHIGRFVLDPARRGSGIGARALTLFCRRLFGEEGVGAVTLRVYRFNDPAIRCYRKCGFEFTEPDGGSDPWDGLGMMLRREDLPREAGSPAPVDMTVPCGGGLVNLRVGAIIRKGGRFLMAGNDRDDYLYSVGGRIRFGETAEEAVVREVEEETGVRMSVDRLGFVHENYFVMDVPPNAGRLVYEVSFYFYMNAPEDFEPVCNSATADGLRERVVWVAPDEPRTIYPDFFRTELAHPAHTVKHFVTDERR